MICKCCGSYIQDTAAKKFCPECGEPLAQKLPISNNAADFQVRGGVLVAYLGNKRDVIIPDGIISIGQAAFKDNLAVETVTFSNSVVSIENNAFEGCANLKRVYNNINITHYGNEAFKYSGLTYISLNNKVEQIGKYCFSRMPELEAISYMPDKDLKLNHAFAFCPKLIEVEMDKFYFFPSMHSSFELKNNKDNKRPTWHDAFIGTPYATKIHNEYRQLYDKGVCPECGGKIKKSLFHAKCLNCKIDYKN